jgi:hypothetical protein
VLNTAGAEVSEPYGLAVDSTTGIVYWANYDGGPANEGSIAYARLDGSGGGVLNTAGSSISGPYRLAVDPGQRVYWGNQDGGKFFIGYANVNNSGGGGVLNATGATTSGFNGFAVDSLAGRLYWTDGSIASYAALSGAGGGDIPAVEAVTNSAYGMAVDPVLGKLYFANYGNSDDRKAAIGTYLLSGVGGGIDIATAPLDSPQDPQILKSPTATAAPVISRSAGSGTTLLSCPTGGWAQDHAGGFVYQAPTTYSYRWVHNGAAIAGAVAPTLTASTPGAYACAVTAANQAGAATSTSAPVTIAAPAPSAPARFKLVLKKRKATVKPGKLATFRIQVQNQGDLRSRNSRLCVKLTKKQRVALKQPKCKQLGKLAPGQRKTVKVKIKVKASAGKGKYWVKLVPKGTGGKPVKVKLKVLG